MYLIKKSTIFDKNIKSQIWQTCQSWWKCQFWGKNQIWDKSQIWEKCQLFMYPPPPPPPPIVYIWYQIIAGPKWNFEKTKRIYFVIVNSCDLDAELETWAASRWKLLMQYSRWFTVLDKFSQSRLNCTILTKIHINNQIS